MLLSSLGDFKDAHTVHLHNYSKVHLTSERSLSQISGVVYKGILDIPNDDASFSSRQVSGFPLPNQPAQHDLLSFSVGLHSQQGSRQHQEDRVIASDLSALPPFRSTCQRALLLAVFDGHEGSEAAQHLADHFVSALINSPVLSQQNSPQASPGSTASPNMTSMDKGRLDQLPAPHVSTYDYGAALRQALLHCEQDLLDAASTAGSTALVALLVDSILHIANVGDCRAVVCDKAEARALTRDHKPLGNAEERERLRGVGADVSSDGYILSPDGSQALAVSRAIGGALLKRPQSLSIMPRVESFASETAAGAYSCPKRQPDLSEPPVAEVPTLHQHSVVGSSIMCVPVEGTNLLLNAIESLKKGSGGVNAPLALSERIHSVKESPFSRRGPQMEVAGGSAKPCSLSGLPPDFVGDTLPLNTSQGQPHSTSFIQECTTYNRLSYSSGLSSPTHGEFSWDLQHEGAGYRGYKVEGTRQLPDQQSGTLVSEASCQTGVIAEPELFEYYIHKGSEFLIIASDGIWDKVSNKEAVTRVRRWLSEDGLSASQAAEKLVEYALRLDTKDNVSVVLLRFSAQPFEPRSRGGSGSASPAYANSALRRARSEAGLVGGASPPPTAKAPGSGVGFSHPSLQQLPTLHEIPNLISHLSLSTSKDLGNAEPVKCRGDTSGTLVLP
ncbi:hypothetical protein CEUSTIGMA_g7695.t1 [Chlamydomonas eustigma]|uniref:protein-serine/threonine phosphatase n=1 Tax=Chlamydomonas eustigma TaxID=1157962 RepID=A0A250XAZ8_9CHLO|nr:hypothetical protein CEUSTIGMA_g7695.t1 [Chlamydomonas eustigma]|eukprot:GAX80257.1 hypothetical protein CEUSTIGMA_g7695.t1 [Chlamydomonas eustigma]